MDIAHYADVGFAERVLHIQKGILCLQNTKRLLKCGSVSVGFGIYFDHKKRLAQISLSE